MFELYWKGECIDSFDTRKEAEAMRREYAMAYGGSVAIREKK